MSNARLTARDERCGPNAIKRREVTRWLLAGFGLAVAAPAEASGPHSEPGPMLRRGDRIDLAGREAAILEAAYQLGYEYEKRYGGCAQCTVAALQDALPFVPAEVGLFRGASCLDGGATPNGLQNCGSFTGAGMVIGYLCGRTRDEVFFGDKGLAQELIRQVYRRFEERYGSVLCKDVRAKAKADCPAVVGDAARCTAEILLETFADYRAPKPPADPNTSPPSRPKP
jgi:C_GCAxxG_C_C family probable redox protein